MTSTLRLELGAFLAEVTGHQPPRSGVSTSYLYGEITGIVGSGDNVTIMNQAQALLLS
jgi:hypothetical protein